MSEYKILVKSVEEVEKAQTLFEKLGFRKGECTLYDLPKLVAAQHDPLLGTYSSGASLYFDSKNKYEWLSMEQLEGLVKDLNDAELVERAKKFITPDHLNRFQAAEAHLQGELVQFMTANGDFIDITDDSTLGIFATDGGYSFRRKPRTVKLEIEVPAPFEPKEGERYWRISFSNYFGYDDFIMDSSKVKAVELMYGAYRTESDIKIVVEQLRKLGVLK